MGFCHNSGKRRGMKLTRDTGAAGLHFCVTENPGPSRQSLKASSVGRPRTSNRIPGQLQCILGTALFSWPTGFSRVAQLPWDHRVTGLRGESRKSSRRVEGMQGGNKGDMTREDNCKESHGCYYLGKVCLQAWFLTMCVPGTLSGASPTLASMITVYYVPLTSSCLWVTVRGFIKWELLIFQVVLLLPPSLLFFSHTLFS